MTNAAERAADRALGCDWVLRFAIRVPEQRPYKIRIHAFKYLGGGNYTLEVLRFQAQPLGVGKLVIGTFDSEGQSYHSLLLDTFHPKHDQ